MYPKVIITWHCSDGSKFRTEDGAIEHENEIGTDIKKVARNINKRKEWICSDGSMFGDEANAFKHECENNPNSVIWDNVVF